MPCELTRWLAGSSAGVGQGGPTDTNVQWIRLAPADVMTGVRDTDRSVAAGLTASAGGLAPWQKRRATALALNNLAEPIRVAHLADECGLSSSHFARSFKASFGVSAHKWLVQRRIERSKELLIHTRESLADIADRVGFADQAAFTRAFRQRVGVSPGRWRRYQLCA